MIKISTTTRYNFLDSYSTKLTSQSDFIKENPPSLFYRGNVFNLVKGEKVKKDKVLITKQGQGHVLSAVQEEKIAKEVFENYGRPILFDTDLGETIYCLGKRKLLGNFWSHKPISSGGTCLMASSNGISLYISSPFSFIDSLYYAAKFSKIFTKPDKEERTSVGMYILINKFLLERELPVLPYYIVLSYYKDIPLGHAGTLAGKQVEDYIELSDIVLEKMYNVKEDEEKNDNKQENEKGDNRQKIEIVDNYPKMKLTDFVEKGAQGKDYFEVILDIEAQAIPISLMVYKKGVLTVFASREDFTIEQLCEKIPLDTIGCEVELSHV